MKKFFRTEDSNTYPTQKESLEAWKEDYIKRMKAEKHVNPVFAFIDDEHTVHPIPEEMIGKLTYATHESGNQDVMREVFKSFVKYMNTVYTSQIVKYIVMFPGTNIRIEGCSEEEEKELRQQISPIVHEYLDQDDVNVNFLEPVVELIEDKVKFPPGCTLDVKRELTIFIEDGTVCEHYVHDIIGDEDGDFVMDPKENLEKSVNKFDESGELSEDYIKRNEGIPFSGVL